MHLFASENDSKYLFEVTAGTPLHNSYWQMNDWLTPSKIPGVVLILLAATISHGTSHASSIVMDV